MEVVNVQNNKIFKREYMKQMADIMDYEHTIEIKDAEIADKDAKIADVEQDNQRLRQIIAQNGIEV